MTRLPSEHHLACETKWPHDKVIFALFGNILPYIDSDHMVRKQVLIDFISELGITLSSNHYYLHMCMPEYQTH